MRGGADAAAPLGVFDSGLGGLTVARALLQALPRERIIYLGDTARVPYGTRSAQTVVRYARGCTEQELGAASCVTPEAAPSSCSSAA